MVTLRSELVSWYRSGVTEHSGRFVLRISPVLHARLRKLAHEQGVSLNQLCRTAIERSVAEPQNADKHGEPDSPWLAQARRVAGAHLQGLVLFGSQARGEARESSDVDLLVVVSREVELRRDLYHRWDGLVADQRVSPHFVHLPEAVAYAGSIWYETALEGIVLYERDRQITTFLQAIRREIADGRLRRRYAHGHPYWVKDLPRPSAEEATDAE